MKTIFLVFVISISCVVTGVESQQQQVYPNLDQGLILLWKNALLNDNQNTKSALVLVQKAWSIAKPKITKLRNSQFDNRKFIDETDLILKALPYYIDNNYVKLLENYSYQLLLDLSSMRSCIGVKNYPLDRLLNLHISYNEIHFTVHDEMMGLLYWFEFQELVEDFIDYWGEYECMDNEDINLNFENIDDELHKGLKDTFNSCLSNFISSLDSANRTDFEIPCEDMGVALRELMWLYAHN